MKKHVCMALAVTMMLLAITGCGNSGKADEAESTTNTSATPSGSSSGDSDMASEGGEKEVEVNGYKFTLDTSKNPEDMEFAVVYMNVSDIFASYLDEGVQAFAQKTGANCYVTGATDWTAESQYNVIDNLITSRPDGIAVAVSDDQTIAPIIDKALEAGIPTICVNSDAPSSGRLSYLGRDDVEAGRVVGEYIVEKLKEKYNGEVKGKVLITTTGAGTNWSDSREAGSREVLEQYDGIEIVDFINAEGDEQQAYGALENALLANPDIDAMCNLGGTMDIWGRLMKNQNRKDIISVGHDLYGNVLDYIQEGYLTASHGQRVFEQAYGACEQLYNFATTADPSSFKENDVPYYIFCVDSSNVDEVIEQRDSGVPIG